MREARQHPPSSIILSRSLLALAGAVLLVATAACQSTGPAEPTPRATPTASAPMPIPSAPPPVQGEDQAAALLPSFQGDLDLLGQATRYAITATLVEDERVILGQASIWYTNTESVPLDMLVLRLYPNLMGPGAGLHLASVEVDGHAVQPELRQEGSVARLPLPSPLSPGQGLALTFSFRTEVSSEPSRGYGAFGVHQGTWTLAGFYPLVAVYDETGWNEEIPPEHGDMVYSDMAFYRVVWEAPEGYILASTGSVVDEAGREGRHVWTLVSGPAREFNLALSRDYQIVTEDDPSGTRLRSFYFPGHAAMGQAVLDYARQAFRLYGDLFGPYPYRELDLAEAEIGAAGIEYPGLILAAEALYAREDPFTEFVVAHEMAHQWWYNLVGNDQVDEPWLDEALANYSTVLYYEHVHGPEEAKGILEAFRQRYENLVREGRDAAVAQPSGAFPRADYGVIVYQKGALFLDALRTAVGDEAFLAVLRHYAAQYRYRIARGQDFLRVAEGLAGRDLAPLYHEWLYGVRRAGE
ncbi:MAG: M1 family metallopeptidase [Anaerolineae bacterium]